MVDFSNDDDNDKINKNELEISCISTLERFIVREIGPLGYVY